MRASLLALGSTLVAACGGPTGIVVEVTGSGLPAFDTLEVTGTNGDAFGPLSYVDPGGGSIALPATLGVELETPVAGPIAVCASALASGTGVASGCADGEVEIGTTTRVTIVLALLGADCGNGAIDAAEECDGTELGGDDCTTIGQGWIGGMLACTSGCLYDTAGCAPPPDCGNDMIDGSEECDGADLGGETCESLAQGFVGGTLACGASCAFDTSGCTAPPGCGTGTIEPGEECDPPALGDGTCLSEAGLVSGTIACTGGCQYDVSGCYACGNGVLEAAEACDGSLLGGTSCVSLGHLGGTLGCAGDCQSLDESACTDCGNGVVDLPEPCDGTDLGGLDCVAAGPFTGGSLACDASCALVTTGCDATPPTVPVLRKPWNHSYVGTIHAAGSLRPTFGWDPATVPSGAAIEYELQWSTDPTFATGTTDSSTPSTTYQPAADLVVATSVPVGSRYHWRVRACVGSVCSDYSTAWKVNVGRSDRDFNGDGYDDTVVGANLSNAASAWAGRAYVHFGGPGPALESTADGVLNGEGPSNQLGYDVASAGDVNGDGYADVVVGAPLLGPGRVYVYFGGPGATLDGFADGVLDGPGGSGQDFGVSVASAGDVNGDGYDDIVVGADEQVAALEGSAYLFLGGPGATLDPTPDATMVGEAVYDRFGRGVGSAGDFDADGYADVAVGADGFDDALGTRIGAVYVYRGGPGATFDDVPDSTLLGTPSVPAAFIGFVAVSAGDVNGDAFGDLVVSDADLARLYFGGPDPAIEPTPDGILTGTPGTGFAYALSGAGDVNGDGFSDVVVGAYMGGGGSPGPGAAYVFFGGAGAAFEPTADGVLAGVAGDDRFGIAVGGAGDVDGDSFDDVIVGANWNDGGGANAGAAYLFRGGSGAAFDAAADGSLLGQAAGENFGGAVASCGPERRVPAGGGAALVSSPGRRLRARRDRDRYRHRHRAA